MGPRSINRGIEGDEHQRLVAGVVLQWGRGRSTAELSLFSNVAMVEDTLQWGRGRSTAEFRRCPDAALVS